MVECFSSYCSRLARAHNVKLSHLIRGVITPEMMGGTYNIDGHYYSTVGAQNSFGKTADLWVKTLETLTLRKDLSFLTMLSYRGIICHKKLLRPHRAWCPRCLEEMKRNPAAAGEPIIYEPLLWKLQPVQVCPRHRQVLEERCPKCRSQLQQVTPTYVPGYCSSCGHWLGGNYASPTKYDIASQVWYADFIGEMLAVAPGLTRLPEKEDIGRFITKLVETRTKGGASALGQLLRISPAYVRCWQKGEYLPNFVMLLKICWRFKADIHQVLRRKPLSPSDLDVEIVPAVEVGEPRPAKTAWTEIEREMRMMVDGTIAVKPVRTIAKTHGRDVSGLYLVLPDLCHQVADLFKKGLKAKREALYVQLEERILEAVEELVANGMYPSQERIFERIPYRGLRVRALINDVVGRAGVLKKRF